MDIRTKLVFAFVGVALASMLGMGVVVGRQVDGIMRESQLDQLEELAESRRQALLWAVEGWRDRTELMAGRTALRSALDAYLVAAQAPTRARIGAFLEDALAGAGGVTLVRIYDLEGALVASSSGRGGATPGAGSVPAAPVPADATRYVGVALGAAGAPQVTFVAPLTWEERLIGSLVATFEARELRELTSSYQGLGETGETIVFFEDPDGVARTLHPTRDDPGGRGGVTLPAGPGSLVARAKTAQPASDRLIDHRGEEVWAATRVVEDTGWGIVVKLDSSEEGQRHAEFRRWLRQTAVILSAFAILAGFGFGMRFALPIHALAEVANRIRSGEMGARAKVVVEDEVGALTRSFNEMADELEQRMEQLHEFHKFFDVSIDLMCIANVDGYFKRVNPAFQRVLGWTDEELLARPFLSFIHPDDVADTEREVAKLAQGIPTISFVNRYQKKDGTYARLRWTSYPEAGRLYAIAHVIDESQPA